MVVIEYGDDCNDEIRNLKKKLERARKRARHYRKERNKARKELNEVKDYCFALKTKVDNLRLI